MKSFSALKRELAIDYLVDWMATALAIFWKGMNQAFPHADQGLFKELQTEMDGAFLAQVTTALKARSTPSLCQMADDGRTGSDMRLEFAGSYLDELAAKIEPLIQHP